MPRLTLTAFILWSSVGSLAAQSGFWAPFVPPHARYQIECRFNTPTELSGNETIHFRNTTKRAMERLALAWSLGPNKTVSVTADGKPVVVLFPPGDKQSNSPLLLQLPESLQPGAELELKVEFRNADQGNLDKGNWLWQSWYPQLWWGFGTADDYEARFTVPSGWGLATSGVLEPSSGIWRGKDVRDFAVWIFDEKKYVVDRAAAGDVPVSVVHTAAVQSALSWCFRPPSM